MWKTARESITHKVKDHWIIAPIVMAVLFLGGVTGAVQFFTSRPPVELISETVAGFWNTISVGSALLALLPLLAIVAAVWIGIAIGQGAAIARQRVAELEAERANFSALYVASTNARDELREEVERSQTKLDACSEAHESLRERFGRFELGRIAFVHGHNCTPKADKWKVHIRFADYGDDALVKRLEKLIHDSMELEVSTELVTNPPLRTSEEGFKVIFLVNSSLSVANIARNIHDYALLGPDVSIGQRHAPSDDRTIVVEVLPSVPQR